MTESVLPTLPVMDTDIEMETVLVDSTDLVAIEALASSVPLPAPPPLGEVEAVDHPSTPPFMDPLGEGDPLLTPVELTEREAAPPVLLAPARDAVTLWDSVPLTDVEVEAVARGDMEAVPVALPWTCT